MGGCVLSDATETAVTPAPRREVYVEDALGWLRARGVLEGTSVITSLPDVSELPDTQRAGWRDWFVEAAALCALAVPDDGLVIYYQTDTKLDGAWVDKGALVGEGAARAGLRCVFHRIVLRAPAGTVTNNRAGYSHMLGFSRAGRVDPRLARADVLAQAGATTWTRGMGAQACRAACEAVRAYTPSRTVLDPFCGHGTVLAVANALGFDAVGVELGMKRAKRARALTLAQLDPLLAAKLTP